jgi:hypothetical protein
MPASLAFIGDHHQESSTVQEFGFDVNMIFQISSGRTLYRLINDRACVAWNRLRPGRL